MISPARAGNPKNCTYIAGRGPPTPFASRLAVAKIVSTAMPAPVVHSMTNQTGRDGGTCRGVAAIGQDPRETDRLNERRRGRNRQPQRRILRQHCRNEGVREAPAEHQRRDRRQAGDGPPDPRLADVRAEDVPLQRRDDDLGDNHQDGHRHRHVQQRDGRPQEVRDHARQHESAERGDEPVSAPRQPRAAQRQPLRCRHGEECHERNQLTVEIDAGREGPQREIQRGLHSDGQRNPQQNESQGHLPGNRQIDPALAAGVPRCALP